MRYIFGIFLLIGFLKVAGQQPPENLSYTTAHVSISNAYATSGMKVFKGEIADYNRVHNTPSIIGTTKKGDVSTTFTPLVPFDQETPYTLVCDDQFFHFEIKRSKDQPAMTVSGIYPSIDEVPANILKWYIQFSQPVNPVKIYEHINFLDHVGKPIDRSILHLCAPLLSEDGTLLTVWIEPGRQKRMLGPNRHLGSVFEPHRQYTLHIADTLKDADGVPIARGVRHTFTTTDSDRTKPSLANWVVAALQADTRQPLKITSNDHLDYGSLLDAFSISLDGHRVEGALTYDSETTTIHFTPIDKWKKGIYTIQLEYQLEDLAGNNLYHLFDRPIEKQKKEVVFEELTLSVVCK